MSTGNDGRRWFEAVFDWMRGAPDPQQAGNEGSAEAPHIESLSGEYLAAAVTDPLIIFDGDALLVHANAAAFAAFGGIVQGMALPLRFRAPEMQALFDSVLSGASASLATASGWPGTVDTFASAASFFEAILSPMAAME